MIFNIAQSCPNGLNVAKTQRLLKTRLALSERPFLSVVGHFDFPRGVYVSGECVILVRKPTEAEPEPPQFNPTAEQLEVVNQSLLESAPANGSGRIKIEDLADLGEVADKGQIVFVADLPRLTNGTGTLAYWSGHKWRRVSDDSEVIVA